MRDLSRSQTCLGNFLWGLLRKLRWAFAACFGFLNEEYLIALVDFIPPRGGAPEPTRLSKDEGSALHPS